MTKKINPEHENIVNNILDKEVIYDVSRSSGAGGQHVNRTESRVQLFRNFTETQLEDEVKARIENKYGNKINKEGRLIIDCQESRSQHKNKNIVNDKLREYIGECLVEPKKRIKTAVTKAAKEKRLDSKKRDAKTKQMRKKPIFDS